MFEKFDAPARMVVVLAQEEARGLRHASIGGGHLLLGLARADPPLLPVGAGTLREQVVARSGTGAEPSPAQMPFSSGAQTALQLAVDEAAYRGDPEVRPAHVLIALLGADAGARAVLDGKPAGGRPPAARDARRRRARRGAAASARRRRGGDRRARHLGRARRVNS